IGDRQVETIFDNQIALFEEAVHLLIVENGVLTHGSAFPECSCRHPLPLILRQLQRKDHSANAAVRQPGRQTAAFAEISPSRLQSRLHLSTAKPRRMIPSAPAALACPICGQALDSAIARLNQRLDARTVRMLKTLHPGWSLE